MVLQVLSSVMESKGPISASTAGAYYHHQRPLTSTTNGIPSPPQHQLNGKKMICSSRSSSKSSSNGGVSVIEEVPDTASQTEAGERIVRIKLKSRLQQPRTREFNNSDTL